MNRKSAFTGSYAENPFLHQQFDFRQIRILRGGQPVVDFHAADNCCIFVTTREAIYIQDEIPSVAFDNFKHHYVLMFDLTSKQDATGKCRYPELVGEKLRPEINFTFHLETVIERLVLGERNVFGCSW